jgi:hypothetical protein
MIKQVAWNKLSLLLRNILQNAQTLQLFKFILKQEVFRKSIENAELKGLGEET